MTRTSEATERRSYWLLPMLAVPVAWIIVLAQPRSGPSMLTGEAWSRMTAFFSRLAGAELDAAPAFVRAEVWVDIITSALGTLTLSVAAAAAAGAMALATVPVAARPDFHAHGVRRFGGVGVRLFYVVCRSIPEIVWGLMAVLVLRPGPMAAAAALAVHNTGVLGRLLTDVVEDLDPRPDDALRSTGAGPGQRYLYGTLPRVVPRCLTFGLYRWEVIIRTTVVVEAVTGTGLGSTLRLALNGRAFTTVTVVLITYVLLVLLVDLISAGLRHLAR